MMFLEKLRNFLYWSLDSIKGGRVKNHYKEIDFILNNYSNSQGIRSTSLSNLLNHAVNSTEFYKRNKNYKGLDDFPVINKNIIRENKKSFQSTKFLGDKGNLWISTSGSTGAILKLLINKNKINRNTADTIYFSKQVGFEIGQKLVFIRHWNKFYKKKKIELISKNILTIDVLDLKDSYISTLLKKLKKDRSNKTILAYASALELICKHLDKNKIKKPITANIKSVIAMSEKLNDYTKNSIKKYFSITPYSRYSNQENGIIAQQTSDSKENFIINWASYFIEVLKFDSNLPVQSGELGRIVVTDLYNYSMPIIRYDTGDVGVIDYEITPPCFTKIEGRKADLIFDTSGNVVFSFIMMNTYNYEGIIQSQFIQNGQKDYLLKLNVNSDFNKEEEILSEFRNYLGKDSKIDIEYVTEIPLLASGKRKVFVNNYVK